MIFQVKKLFYKLKFILNIVGIYNNYEQSAGSKIQKLKQITLYKQYITTFLCIYAVHIEKT